MLSVRVLHCNLLFQGDLSRNLYVIKRGHCDVVTEDLAEVTDHLVSGDYFGEIEVIF